MSSHKRRPKCHRGYGQARKRRVKLFAHKNGIVVLILLFLLFSFAMLLLNVLFGCIHPPLGGWGFPMVAQRGRGLRGLLKIGRIYRGFQIHASQMVIKGKQIQKLCLQLCKYAVDFGMTYPWCSCHVHLGFNLLLGNQKTKVLFHSRCIVYSNGSCNILQAQGRVDMCELYDFVPLYGKDSLLAQSIITRLFTRMNGYVIPV
jgi:hypothetical protein